MFIGVLLWVGFTFAPQILAILGFVLLVVLLLAVLGVMFRLMWLLLSHLSRLFSDKTSPTTLARDRKILLAVVLLFSILSVLVAVVAS